MIISDLSEYLTLTGKFVDFSNEIEETLDVLCVSKIDEHSELLVDAVLDLESFCLDESINIDNIAKITIVFNGAESAAKKFNLCNEQRELVQIVDKRNGLYTIDLNYLKTSNSFNNQVNFSIRTKESLNETISFNSCEISFEYLDYYTNEPDYDNYFIEGKIDDLLNYKLNLYSGRIDFSREVIALYGNKSPFKLTQFFNQYKDNNLFDYWKFNYFQKIYLENGIYYWIDEKFRTHKFSMLTSSLYYDIEHTGLVLRVYTNEYVITNDRTIFYHFNLNMDLVSVESKKGTNSTFININQITNGYSFIDGMGRNFQYLSNASNSFLVLPNQSQLSFSFGSESDTFVDVKGEIFTFNYKIINNRKMLSNAISSSGKKVCYIYDEYLSPIKIEEYFDNQITNRILIEYKENYTTVISIKNPSGLFITSKKTYQFTNDGKLITILDLSNDNEEITSFINYSTSHYDKFKIIINENDVDNFSRDNMHENVNCFGISTGTLHQNEEYVIYAILDGNKFNFSESNALRIDLLTNYYDAEVARTLWTINYQCNGKIVFASKIKPEEYSEGYIYIQAVGNTAYQLDNNTFFLARVKKEKSIVIATTTNKISGEYQEKINNSTIYWDKINSLKFVGVPNCEEITMNDWNFNLVNRLANNQTVLWYNDLSKAFLPQNNINIIVNNLETFNINDLTVASYKKEYEKAKFDYLKVVNNELFAFSNANWNIERGLVKQKIDQYGNVIQVEDSLGVTTNYTLDSFGRTILTRKEIPSIGVFKSEKIYEYSENQFKEIDINEDGLRYENTFNLLTGSLVSSKNPSGEYVYFSYDNANRLINTNSSNNMNSISYDNDKISALESSDGNGYSFIYNEFEDLVNIKIGENNHINKSYKKSPIKESINTLYSNSKGNIEVYNRFGKLVQKGSISSLSSNGVIGVNHIYGSIFKNVSGINSYDFEDYNINEESVLRKSIYTSLSDPYTIEYFYNINGNLISLNVQNEITIDYTYTNGNLLSQESYSIVNNNYYNNQCAANYYYSNIDEKNGSRQTSFEFNINVFLLYEDYYYDEASRLGSKEIGIVLPEGYGATTFSYENTYKTRVENNETLLSDKLSSRTFIIDQDNYEITDYFETTESFTYNSNGLLETITIDGYRQKFTYDSLNRLIREDNELLNRTFTYFYNNAGNITSKKEYLFTYSELGTPLNVFNYSYNSNAFKDRLTGWSNYIFTYDNGGYLLNYKNATLTWNSSNKLSKYLISSINYSEFEYNADGVRRRKKSIENNVEKTHIYTYNGTKLLIDNITGNENKQLVFIYNKEEIIGFYNENEMPFYFRKNILGDVIEIYDYLGVLKAQYAYDAWGNCEIVYEEDDIGSLNPIRYRSYYYDSDTNLYYLITRYYDPEIGRFISLDSYEYLDYQKVNGLNLYAYCMNNPVKNIDPEGNFAELFFVFIAIIAFSGCLYVYSSRVSLQVPLGDSNEVPKDRKQENGEGIISDSVNLNGVAYFYKIKFDKVNDLSVLTIYNCYKYSDFQIKALLNYLNEYVDNVSINVGKVMNEWAWHKLGYKDFGIENCKNADMYFNSDDTDHKLSFLINLRIWY